MKTLKQLFDKFYKRKYYKNVEIPTGVETKILTSLEGEIEVFFDVKNVFDNKISYLVEYWRQNNDDYDLLYHTIEVESKTIASKMNKELDRCGKGHNATIINHNLILN